MENFHANLKENGTLTCGWGT